jgi:DNA-binding NtrC family response regulator
VLGIEVPPLRERPDDVPILASYFLSEVARKLRREPPAMPSETLAALKAYSWPGNVRELRNVLERALVLDPEAGLRRLDLLPGGGAPAPARSGDAADLNLRSALAKRERELLDEALRRSDGSRKDTARLLGIDPRNLSYYLRKHGLESDTEGS